MEQANMACTREIALLYLLGHQGEYRNRLTAEWLGEVETVPWV